MVRKEEYFKNGNYFECNGCYDGIEIKACSRCKKEYYATSINFRKRPKLKCGFESACRNCEREYNKNNYNKDYHKEYRENNKEKIREYKKEYELKTQCSKLWKENNRECVKEYNKEYRKTYTEEQKEHIREYKKEYYQTKNGKERARIATEKRRAKKRGNGGSYTKEQWEECLKFFKYSCAYTGEDLSNGNLHVDHIVPLQKGGTNYIHNLCPSVSYANLSKSSKDMEEWYREQPYFDEARLSKIYEWMEYAKEILKEE